MTWTKMSKFHFAILREMLIDKSRDYSVGKDHCISGKDNEKLLVIWLQINHNSNVPLHFIFNRFLTSEKM